MLFARFGKCGPVMELWAVLGSEVLPGLPVRGLILILVFRSFDCGLLLDECDLSSIEKLSSRSLLFSWFSASLFFNFTKFLSFPRRILSFGTLGSVGSKEDLELHEPDFRITSFFGANKFFELLFTGVELTFNLNLRGCSEVEFAGLWDPDLVR